MNGHANQVEVDADADLALIASIGETAGAAEAELEHATAGHDPAAWSTFADHAAELFGGVVVPNWKLGADDRRQVSGAIAGVMDHYFPGAIAGADKWHPLAQLAFVLATVTAARGVDWSTMTLKPLREKDSDDGDSEAAGRLEPVPSGDDPQRQNGPGFTMGGG